MLTIELVAEHPGDYVGEITVKSEVNLLTLTVSAKVLPAPAVLSTVSAKSEAADGEEEVGAVGQGGTAVAADLRPGSVSASASAERQVTLKGEDEGRASQ